MADLQSLRSTRNSAIQQLNRVNDEIGRLDRVTGDPSIPISEARAAATQRVARRAEAAEIEREVRRINAQIFEIEDSQNLEPTLPERDPAQPASRNESGGGLDPDELPGVLNAPQEGEPPPATSSDPQLTNLIGNPDPDAWQALYPDYTPPAELRASKAIAVSRGISPEARGDAAADRLGALGDPQVAFVMTPLSDEDLSAAESVAQYNITQREVPGVEIGVPQNLRNVGSTTSAGQIVKNEQDAGSEGANTQHPEPELKEADDQESASVAERDEGAASPIANDQSGFDEFTGAAAGLGITGQTPADLQAPPPSTVSDDQGSDSLSDADDEENPDVIVENVTIPGEFTRELEAKPNVLSQFFSYSYSLSLYLMKPGDYELMVRTGQKKLFNSTLLIQSGGIPINAEDSRRNEFFDVDFYINNLEIESLVTGKATQGAHNATTMRFDINEPYGISFLDRLRNAVADFRGSDENILSQIYLLVIRFYGYDEEGNLVQPESKGEEATDSNSAIEKFIPFMWRNIKFTIASQAVVYQCEAVAVNQYVGLGQLQTSIPYNIEISGQSLTELFNGEAVFADRGGQENQGDDDEDAGAPDSENAATLRQGLVAALNKFERKNAESKGALPNEYAIKLDDSVGLTRAKMAQDSEAYLANLPMAGRTTQTIGQQMGTDNTRRKYSLVAGQPIVQVLDLLVRSSTYITDQQLVKITENPSVDRNIGKVSDGKYLKLREGNQGPVAWYKITTQVEPKEYDPRRGEYSYKITYIISGYQVNDLISEFFPAPPFRGVHKKYDYWFTGANTEVLQFEQSFNSLFYLRMAPEEVLRASGIVPLENRSNISKFTTQDTSDQSETMGTGDSLRPSADAASRLYSPADQAIAELRIFGDPAWIQQSELLYSNVEGINHAPFLPDDSINYDSQEPLFQLTYNLPTDYDVEGTGTMPVTKFNQTQGGDINSHQFIYRANRIVNSFSNGEFIQQISATQMFDTDQTFTDDSGTAFPLLGDALGLSSNTDNVRDADSFGPRDSIFPLSGIDIQGSVDDD